MRMTQGASNYTVLPCCKLQSSTREPPLAGKQQALFPVNLKQEAHGSPLNCELIRANETLEWQLLFGIFKEIFTLQGLEPVLRASNDARLSKTKLNKCAPDHTLQSCQPMSNLNWKLKTELACYFV